MGLFGKSTFLEKDLEAWSLETWAWLMGSLGGMRRLERTPLVLANKDFFPPTDTEGADEQGGQQRPDADSGGDAKPLEQVEEVVHGLACGRGA